MEFAGGLKDLNANQSGSSHSKTCYCLQVHSPYVTSRETCTALHFLTLVQLSDKLCRFILSERTSHN